MTSNILPYLPFGTGGQGKYLDNGNKAFKRRVYEILGQTHQSVGSVDLHDKQPEDIKFEIFKQTDKKGAWKPDLAATLTWFTAYRE